MGDLNTMSTQAWGAAGIVVPVQCYVLPFDVCGQLCAWISFFVAGLGFGVTYPDAASIASSKSTYAGCPRNLAHDVDRGYQHMAGIHGTLAQGYQKSYMLDLCVGNDPTEFDAEKALAETFSRI
ncbi:hypothetical protein CQW23_06039 [Capsicum baccatum]|uniref:Uncharacterized protein n=1 Tax=Capsicum baccatum TaxID=33114 RepID=A0A2G2X257_CAPBA|nr:hypothetical protein CQW23_06039 [Capsicum baccatum]